MIEAPIESNAQQCATIFTLVFISFRKGMTVWQLYVRSMQVSSTIPSTQKEPEKQK